MKINWKLRLKNKTTLMALLTMLVAIVYEVLAAFNIVPKFQQEQVLNFIKMVVGVLVLMGIVTDPTTEGISDSDKALKYKEPKRKGAK